MIGSDAVHPIEMAAAYAAVADGGVYHPPSFIDHIVDRSGDDHLQRENPGHQVVSPQIAAEATAALQAVVQYGTGTAAELYDRPVAGKTGTTSSQHRRLVQRLHAAAGDDGVDGQPGTARCR